MKDDTQFENLLRRQPLKSIPGEWREDILRQAAGKADGRRIATAREVTTFKAFKCWLIAWWSPSPRAWAGLAAVWAAILVLNLSGGNGPATTAMANPISPAQMRMALKQQQMLLIELAGRAEPRPAAAPRATAPGPRSQRREEIWAV